MHGNLNDDASPLASSQLDPAGAGQLTELCLEQGARVLITCLNGATRGQEQTAGDLDIQHSILTTTESNVSKHSC